MIRCAILTVLALPFAAQAQEAVPRAELMSSTHIHGIAAGTEGLDSATLATHHGVFTVDLAVQTAVPIGSSRGDFMGFSPVSRADAAVLYGIGHDSAVQRSGDAGASWVLTGTAPDKLIDIATAATEPDQIYAATENGARCWADRAG